MILDMLANFDWKRPIYMTQVYILQDFGLMDYLQFDGYAAWCRSSPRRRTPTRSDASTPTTPRQLLRDTFRYGNLEDPRVYADYFISTTPFGLARPRRLRPRGQGAAAAEPRRRGRRAARPGGWSGCRPRSALHRHQHLPLPGGLFAASAMGDKEAAAKGDAPLEGVCPDADRRSSSTTSVSKGRRATWSRALSTRSSTSWATSTTWPARRPQGGGGRTNDYYCSLGSPEENLIDVGDKRQQPDSALLPAAG